MFASIGFAASAQIKSAKLQASGLTCSMCSNAINQALESLPFVEKVISNIKESSFSISFKPEAAVSIDELREKVEEAGFSVADLSLVIDLTGVVLKPDTHLQASGFNFHILKTDVSTGTSNHRIKLVDKGFVTNKIFKKNKVLTKMDCYDSGKAANCCTTAGIAEGTRIYHVII